MPTKKVRPIGYEKLSENCKEAIWLVKTSNSALAMVDGRSLVRWIEYSHQFFTASYFDNPIDFSMASQLWIGLDGIHLVQVRAILENIVYENRLIKFLAYRENKYAKKNGEKMGDWMSWNCLWLHTGLVGYFSLTKAFIHSKIDKLAGNNPDLGKK